MKRLTALIKKETSVDPRTQNQYCFATLSLLNEAGEPYDLPRSLAGYDEVGALLRREAASHMNKCKIVIPPMRGAKKCASVSRWIAMSRSRT